MRTAFRVDRHAGLAQRLDVAMDRPDRHLELVRQLARRQLAAGLEQQEDETRREARIAVRIADYMTVSDMDDRLPCRRMTTSHDPGPDGGQRPLDGRRRGRRRAHRGRRWRYGPDRHGVVDRPDDDRAGRVLPARRR